MRVQVEYYAVLREERGETAECLETSATTPRDLYENLRRQHGFSLDETALKVVVNEEFSDWESPLAENDTVVFIPPVAGG